MDWKLIANVCLSCLMKLTQVVTTNWRWWQHVCPGVQELLCHKNTVRRLCSKGMASLPFHCYTTFSVAWLCYFILFLSSSAWSCKPSFGCLTSWFPKPHEQNQISTVCCRRHTLAWTILTAMDHLPQTKPSMYKPHVYRTHCYVTVIFLSQTKIAIFWIKLRCLKKES